MHVRDDGTDPRHLRPVPSFCVRRRLHHDGGIISTYFWPRGSLNYNAGGDQPLYSSRLASNRSAGAPYRPPASARPASRPSERQRPRAGPARRASVQRSTTRCRSLPVLAPSTDHAGDAGRKERALQGQRVGVGTEAAPWTTRKRCKAIKLDGTPCQPPASPTSE
jgi:hypothetical protein